MFAHGSASLQLFPVVWIFLRSLVVLSKACKPDNFESHNCLKLSFTNIQCLDSNFVDCESSPDILALCETNLDGSIDSGNFSVKSYLPLIQKDSSTHIHGLAVYVKCEGRTSFCTRFLFMFPNDFTSFSVLLLFLLSIIFVVFLHGF